jgi:hypothetical protein
MRLAGAGMTLALVLVLVLDFTGGGTKGGGAPSAANVQQFAAAQNSDSSSSAEGIASAPTPAPRHSDLGAEPGPVGGPSPAIEQTDGSPSIDKSLPGTTEGSATNAPAALDVQPPDSGAQQPAAASTGSGGGVDVLLIVALALAAGIVLTVTASFVLPRLGRDDV